MEVKMIMVQGLTVQDMIEIPRPGEVLPTIPHLTAVPPIHHRPPILGTAGVDLVMAWAMVENLPIMGDQMITVTARILARDIRRMVQPVVGGQIILDLGKGRLIIIGETVLRILALIPGIGGTPALRADKVMVDTVRLLTG
jgi:hypothetical protein